MRRKKPFKTEVKEKKHSNLRLKNVICTGLIKLTHLYMYKKLNIMNRAFIVIKQLDYEG